MVGFSEEAIAARGTRRDIKAAIQYARRQMIAALEDSLQRGLPPGQVLFRMRTMRLEEPSGDSARDDARILAAAVAVAPEVSDEGTGAPK